MFEQYDESSEGQEVERSHIMDIVLVIFDRQRKEETNKPENGRAENGRGKDRSTCMRL